MLHPVFPYRIFPLGDSALTIDLGNRIDTSINEVIITRFRDLQKRSLTGMTEAVPAYSSLTIHYDLVAVKTMAGPALTAYEWMKTQLENRWAEPLETGESSTRFLKIPVCYEQDLAPDIRALAECCHLSVEEVIREHTSRTYKVYMLGFLPGFAYMGEVSQKIAMPRKSQPVPVAEGSVGIAGLQTGIYPMDSPGGWQIIGRTPERLFDRTREEPVLFRAGDRVQFYSISRGEYESIVQVHSGNK